MAKSFNELLDDLSGLDFSGMYNADFLHTWDKTTDELKALYAVAAALRDLRERNISPRIFNSSFRTSTRARARSLTARPSARPPR